MQAAYRVRPGELAAALLLLALAAASLHGVCDWMYRCGCRPVWAGGTQSCNIHQPEVPHCPWCTGGTQRLLWVGALLLGTPLLLERLASRRGWRGGGRLLAALLGYALGVLCAGLLAALASGYPRWLGLPL
jgi:hypothetical protein